jgi:hypothetical protein
MRRAGQLQTARDHYHAAMLLQHGKGSMPYRLARDLAREAARRDATRAEARWLSAAAQDRYRYLPSMGQPQWYGTQVNKPAGATRWTLEPIDTSAVTDADRRVLGAESLAEARARVTAMNKAADSAAAVRQP